MSQEAMAIDNAPAIGGLIFRGFGGERDYPHIAAIESAAWAADGIPFVTSVEEVAVTWSHMSTSDPYRDTLFAEVDGEPVAYAHIDLAVNDAGEQIFWHSGFVKPAWRRKGIGGALFEWCMRHNRELAEAMPHAGPRYHQTWAFAPMAGLIALAQRHGYETVRYGFMMKRDLGAPILDYALPPGIETRPVTGDQIRTIFAARNEAFRDHFGHREASEADFERWAADPYTRQDLWQVAWDTRTNEVAGEVRVAIVEAENAAYGLKRGWTDPISVRRPYRKQGVAKALIARAMRALQGAGMQEAYLGVDALNPNGALKLYESLGYVVDQRTYQYRKAF